MNNKAHTSHSRLTLSSSPQRKTICLFVVLFSFVFNPAFGQLTDNFNDAEIFSSPAWSGNTENFTALNNELQLMDSDPVLTQSYLSTPNTMSSLDGKEWRIWINQTFSGSDANQSRIYLTSNTSSFSYTANNSAGAIGYYLKLGEALSGDVLRFYKDDGTSVQLIASGTTNISASFQMSIKVSRNASGNWTIAIDTSGGENYVDEMTFTENSLNTSDYFGIVCTYTSSNADNFFFDDIYVGDPILDTTPPEIISVVATSATTVDVLFSEGLNQTIAETENNYVLSTSANPSTAILDGSINSLVHLTFATPFALNTTYTLTTSNIADLFGLTIVGSLENDFEWVSLAIANYHDVVFNEILADPSPQVGLPDVEFVELHNPGTINSFDLNNWQFVNSTTSKILPPFILGPGEYVLLCNEPDAALLSAYGEVIGIPSFTALTNGEDSLTILNENGSVIDVVHYFDSWYASEVKRAGGWSLELINPLLPCQTSANWYESGNASGGTPGTINSVFDLTPDITPPTVISWDLISSTLLAIQFSETMDTSEFSIPDWSLIPFNSVFSAEWNSSLDRVILTPAFPLLAPEQFQLTVSGIKDCSGNMIVNTLIQILIGFLPIQGDVVINEIMPDPDPSLGMPAAEYIELRNNTNTLLDISDVVINNGFFTGQVLLEPDSFIVIADINDAAAFTSISNVAFMEGFPSLTNSGLLLELATNQGDQLDLLSYNLDWYKDDSKIDGGWSLEKINPLAICNGIYNWKASTNVSGGTAGTENSVYNIAPNGSPFVTGSGSLSANQIYIRFNESMDVNSVSSMDISLNPFNSVLSPIWNIDKDQLIFSVSTPLIPELEYDLNITGLVDCDGNAVTPSILQFFIGLPPQAGDIIINEIMADGSSDSQIASPKFDFVEIHNKTAHAIELTQIRINDGFFSEQVVIFPDSFLVITDVSSDPISFFAFPNTAFMEDFPALTEDGTEITLEFQLEVLDAVIYNKTYYNDPTKEDGGYSMELINPEDPCSSLDNWHACVNGSGSSAGKRNSVYSNIPDTSGPTLLYVIAEPQESITLVFNEPIDESSLAGISWTVNGELQSNVNPTLYGDENNQVILYYGEMEAGVAYSFDLTGIEDCWGNSIGLIQNKFALPESPEIGDIIINEILFNPFSNGEDFIEIYNNSLKNLSLSGWKIADATNDIMNTGDIISESNILFFPGEYLILTQEGSGLLPNYPGTQVNRIWKVTGMSDFTSDDHVFLLMPDDNISEDVKYDEGMHFPLLNNTDGVSLERISFTRSSADRTNWHSASELSGFATPGYVNSQSDLSSTNDGQFSAEPEIFSPDNDGNNDVVTLSYSLDLAGYTGNIKIFDSEGRLVRHLMKNELLGTTGSISWDGFTEEKQKASIGIYVIYFEAFNLSGSIAKNKTTCVLAHSLN